VNTPQPAAGIPQNGLRTTLKRVIPRPVRDAMRQGIEAGDLLLAKCSPAWQLKRKHRLEVEFWTKQRRKLMDWYERRADWNGFPAPEESQKVASNANQTLNAVQTLHRLYRDYLKRLALPPDSFAGKRVLDVGCGPLAPSQQFTGAQHHLADPLLDQYVASGWPMTEYGMTLTRAGCEKMPYPDAFFDVMMSMNALDHVDDFHAGAAEMQRILKPGGEIHLEVEYHFSRDCEPLELNDSIVCEAFSQCTLEKVADRRARDLFGMLGRNYRVLPGREEDRIVVWRGKKRQETAE
jgi:SAM-dependent methyltransferase